MRSNAISFIKGVAIVGVVFHHISNRRLDASVTDSLASLQSFFSWAVLMFVAVAGWLHAVTEEKKKVGFLDFSKSRFFRLIVPYVFLVFFYSLIWQFLQVFGLSGVGVRLSDSLWGKIHCSINLVCYEPVAEQLYFLPVLFVISITARLFSLLFGPVRGAILLMALSLSLGLGLTPDSKNTGLNIGFFLFGLYCYSSGFLLYAWRKDWRCVPYVILSVLAVLSLSESESVSKVVPVLVIMSIFWLEKLGVSGLTLVGEASGTIYAYHTPFVLQPMVIAVSRMPVEFQYAGALCSALAVVLLLSVAHHLVKNTRFRKLLL